MFFDALAMILLVVGVVGFWTALISFWADGLKLGLSRTQCLLIILVSALLIFASVHNFLRG